MNKQSLQEGKVTQQSKGQETLLSILRRHNPAIDTLCRDWEGRQGRLEFEDKFLQVKKFDKLENCDKIVRIIEN